MKEDKEAILPVHSCTHQEKQRRRVVLTSATRIIQQASLELVWACLGCLVLVSVAALLLVCTATLLGVRPGPHEDGLQQPQGHLEEPGLQLSFVSLGEDCEDSPRCRCAVEAAARLHPDLPCHVYNILDGQAERVHSSSPGLAALPNVRLHHNTSARFFGDSPLGGWWRDAPPGLRAFAARVLVLWRHGGVSPAPGVSPLAGAPLAPGAAVLLEPEEGLVLRAPGPCHALLFELMRALGQAGGDSGVRDVVAATLRGFCGARAACPGVELLPREQVCGTPSPGDNHLGSPRTCAWVTVEESQPGRLCLASLS
ncbi:uncharacterized protein LOC134538104 [Bacillus rossius redtenbacheri]|uniref:uncharacterized protein LOC134538104 n=1 Tax=Bacillus rossius redtenbacheri TaxID=93214 RepID=UPI002FDC8DA6